MAPLSERLLQLHAVHIQLMETLDGPSEAKIRGCCVLNEQTYHWCPLNNIQYMELIELNLFQHKANIYSHKVIFAILIVWL